VCLNKN